MAADATWPVIFEKRAAIYHWFSGIFAHELSEEQFAAYQQGRADEWLEQFTLIGLEKEVKILKKSIYIWQQKDFNSLDLCADFAQLFLLDSKTAALPYASFYLEKDGRLYGKIESQMRHFLTENRLQIAAEFKEPADHLAVSLAVVSNWIDNSVKKSDLCNTAAEQADFLQQALLSWLPQFTKRCQAIATESDFYAAIAALLTAFIQADKEYLLQLESCN